MSALIETISQESHQQIVKLTNELKESLKIVNQLNAAFKSVVLPSDLRVKVTETTQAIKKNNETVAKSVNLQKQREAQINKESQLREKLTAQMRREQSQREAQINKESQLRQRLVITTKQRSCSSR